LDDFKQSASWRKLAGATSGLRQKLPRLRRPSRKVPAEGMAESRAVHEDEPEPANAAAGK